MTNVTLLIRNGIFHMLARARTSNCTSRLTLAMFSVYDIAEAEVVFDSFRQFGSPVLLTTS